jgi:hypothetical protein
VSDSEGLDVNEVVVPGGSVTPLAQGDAEAEVVEGGHVADDASACGELGDLFCGQSRHGVVWVCVPLVEPGELERVSVGVGEVLADVELPGDGLDSWHDDSGLPHGMQVRYETECLGVDEGEFAHCAVIPSGSPA